MKVLEKSLQDFRADKRALETLDSDIREFEESSQLDDLNQMSSKMESIKEKAGAAKNELEALQPGLVEIQKAVDDRERHKRQLQQNVDILVAESRISALNLEIDQLQKEKDSIDGAQSAEDEHKALRTQKDGLLQKKARSDGMFSSHMEQIRALKVGYWWSFFTICLLCSSFSSASWQRQSIKTSKKSIGMRGSTIRLRN